MEGESHFELASPASPAIWAMPGLPETLMGVDVVTPGGRASGGSVGVRGGCTSTGVGERTTGPTAALVGVCAWGLMMAQAGRSPPPPMPLAIILGGPGSNSLCIASELRMTRKWVLSDGVMVTVLGSSYRSFLGAWTERAGGHSSRPRFEMLIEDSLAIREA